MTVKFKPLHDRILVSKVEESYVGSIIVPDSAKEEKSGQGKVVAVGPGARREDGTIFPPSVKAGDIVVYAKWSGTEFKVDGDSYIIIKDSDVLGIIES